MTNNKNEENDSLYICEKCKFKCSYICDFDRHKLTAKHKMLILTNTRLIPTKLHECQCGKIYKHKSSYCKHKRTCSFLLHPIEQSTTQLELFIEEQRKEREDHKKDIQLLTEKISKMTPVINNTNNTTNNNTTNNKFNLNFFLNTQCKDAMSIQSFMENLRIGSKELEHMGDVGFLNGMIDIFNNTIGNMDIHKRPLHCTDKKREVLYFKQGDEWEKDSTDKQQLKKLIKDVETKNYYNVREWSKAHKESFTSETAAGDQYMKIATEALGGADSTKDTIYLSKIMKHIIREVTVKA